MRISSTVPGDDSGRARGCIGRWPSNNTLTLPTSVGFLRNILTVILRRPGGSRGLFGHGFPELIAITGLERIQLGVPQCTDYYRLGNVIEATVFITHA